MVHGGSVALAFDRRCPCTPCDSYRERCAADISRDPAAVDHVAVELVADGLGYHERLTVAERAEVVRLLHHRRYSDNDIARRTGMAAKTVLRIRRRLTLPAVPR
jgi:hypothetical protein